MAGGGGCGGEVVPEWRMGVGWAVGAVCVEIPAASAGMTDLGGGCAGEGGAGMTEEEWGWRKGVCG